MGEQTTITIEAGGVWSTAAEAFRWLVETEVSLAVVVVLLLIGAVREGINWWFKRRTNDA